MLGGNSLIGNMFTTMPGIRNSKFINKDLKAFSTLWALWISVRVIRDKTLEGYLCFKLCTLFPIYSKKI